jgi:glycosyltransferase involved in cell wall biosynthesis
LKLSDAVMLSTSFVEPEEAALFLQLTDVIVLPYQGTRESSSASVRFALGSGRPVITTTNAIFSDVSESTLQVESSSPTGLANAINNVMRDSALAERLAKQAFKQAKASSWHSVANYYLTELLPPLFNRRFRH